MSSKSNKDPNVDPWGTQQVMVAASKKTAATETKKLSIFEIRVKPCYFLI